MGSNRNYEAEINKMADILKNKPELLKILLRNYDELVKKTYLSDRRDSMKEYPYWCYGVVFNNDFMKGDKL